MLQKSQVFLQRGLIAIHPRHKELILALKGAVAQDYHLDKDRSVHNDVYDAFRLCGHYLGLPLKIVLKTQQHKGNIADRTNGGLGGI
jgi:hypothetical protein